MLEKLEFLLNGASVSRFHVMPTLRANTVGHHSFMVAWLCWMLTDGKARSQLLLAALAHDLAEQRIGDIPSTTKNALKIVEKLDYIENSLLREHGFEFALEPWEKKILNLADWFDGMLYCVSERRLGNKNVTAAFWRYRAFVTKMTSESAVFTMEILQSIEKLWQNAGGQAK